MTSRTFVSAEELKAIYAAPDVVVVDVRTALGHPEVGAAAFRRGHVPGAVHAQLDTDLSGPVVPGTTGRHPLPDPDALAKVLGAWGIGAGVRVIAYDDQGGAFAARLWWLLGWLGHDDVAVLEGGWSAWASAGGAVEVGDAGAKTSREFRPRVRHERTVDAALIERETPTLRLIDARAADRFAGENETIDPVGGHVPGARNLPWASLLRVDKTVDETDTLRRRIDEALADVPPEQAVVYCGSGVTACLDLLVMTHVGRGGARLYPGSWSEWITDPRRGVARGPA